MLVTKFNIVINPYSNIYFFCKLLTIVRSFYLVKSSYSMYGDIILRKEKQIRDVSKI